VPAANFKVMIPLAGTVTNPAGNMRISCKAASASGTVSMLSNFTGESADSTIRVVRIN
jgi:hypothetical protein